MEEIFVETAHSDASQSKRGFSARKLFSRNGSGRVSHRPRAVSHQIKLTLLIFYAIAIPTFIIVGLQPADTSAEVRASEAAAAEEYLSIRSIGLETPLARVSLKNNTLNAPQYIAGVYHSHENKILIIGHSLTVFENLNKISLGDKIDYEDGTYVVTDLKTLEKSEINMSEVLEDESEKTMILMTCAGEQLSGVDFSHRLIVTAEKL